MDPEPESARAHTGPPPCGVIILYVVLKVYFRYAYAAYCYNAGKRRSFFFLGARATRRVHRRKQDGEF